MSENLRREARVEARIRVTVVRGRRSVPLETSDVSFKGLFLRTDDPPPVRSLMRLRVSLPSREIEAHAMAVHVITPADVEDGERDPTKPAPSRGSGVGVQFWGLAGPDRTAWDDFVRELIQLRRTTTQSSKSHGESNAGAPSGVRIVNLSEPPPPHRSVKR
jgi:hypothetical protein